MFGFEFGKLNDQDVVEQVQLQGLMGKSWSNPGFKLFVFWPEKFPLGSVTTEGSEWNLKG